MPISLAQNVALPRKLRQGGGGDEEGRGAHHDLRPRLMMPLYPSDQSFLPGTHCSLSCHRYFCPLSLSFHRFLCRWPEVYEISFVRKQMKYVYRYLSGKMSQHKLQFLRSDASFNSKLAEIFWHLLFSPSLSLLKTLNVSLSSFSVSASLIFLYIKLQNSGNSTNPEPSTSTWILKKNSKILNIISNKEWTLFNRFIRKEYLTLLIMSWTSDSVGFWPALLIAACSSCIVWRYQYV